MTQGLGTAPVSSIYAVLPTDRARASVSSFIKTRLDFNVDRAWIDNVETLAQQYDVSTWCVLSAALAVVIARHAQNEVVPIGVWSVTNQSSWTVRATLITVSEQPAKGLVTSVPQAPTPAPEARVATALVVGKCESNLATMVDAYRLAESDVVVTVDLEARAGRVDYDHDLFDGGTIERFLDEWHTVLHGFSTAPEAPVTGLSLVSAAASQQLLVDWNQTDRVYSPTLVPQLIREQALRAPDAPAVIFEREVCSYGSLDQRIERLSRWLTQTGVSRDELVGVCMDRSFSMVEALCAVMRAGGAYVPIDPEYPRERVRFMLDDAGVRLLLTQQARLPELPEHSGRAVAVDRPLPDHEGPAVPSAIDGDALAYMIYTSGTTGRPKGALNTHRGLANRLFWMQELLELTDRDVFLQKTPFSFDVSVWEFFLPLVCGARLVVARPGGHRDPEYLMNLIEYHGVTVVHFVPSMLRTFLEGIGRRRCPTLRHVICSGEALDPGLRDRFFDTFDAALHNLYGPTEAAVDVTAWTCPRGDRRPMVPIGRPMPNTRAYILDSAMRPVPIGVPGELYLGGVQVGRGYHNRPELTAERFVADPFSRHPTARLYRTGDDCRFASDGTIEFLGRRDDQVKIRGFRIELGEIEAQLTAIPSVAQVVVAVHDTPRGGRMLIAYLVARKGEVSVPAGTLRSLLAGHLPDYMVPSRFVWLDRMPLSPSGKLDRRALPAASENITDDVKPANRAETETERLIADVWAQVLGRSDIGSDVSFFEIGGDSLRIVEVQRSLRARFGDRVNVTALFRHPTIRSLARYLTCGPEKAPLTDVELRASRQREAHARQRRRSQS